MARRKRYDVFVSYSRNDAVIVKPLVQVLSLARRRVFWDEIIEPGQEWTAEIETALAVSDAVVIMWCCDSAASAWVAREISIARKLSKPLTPIRLCAYPLQGAVSHFQAINLSKDLHHSCDCASKEEEWAHRMRFGSESLHLAIERSHLAVQLDARDSHARPRYKAPHLPVRAIMRNLIVLLLATAAGYFTFRLGYGRIAIGAVAALLLVGVLTFTIVALMDRRTALRKQRVADTISLIREALRSEASANP